MVPFKNMGAVSYSHSVVTMAVSLAVSTQYTNVTDPSASAVSQTDGARHYFLQFFFWSHLQSPHCRVMRRRTSGRRDERKIIQRPRPPTTSTVCGRRSCVVLWSCRRVASIVAAIAVTHRLHWDLQYRLYTVSPLPLHGWHFSTTNSVSPLDWVVLSEVIATQNTRNYM